MRDLDLERHLADPALKQAYVTRMFDLVAPRYDDFTRLFSFGMDRKWKASLVARARETVARRGLVADVATGTGDIGLALALNRMDVTVIAIDASGNMLEAARQRVASEPDVARRVWLAGGDLAALPLPAASVDAVTAGYALRNAPDWRASLRELARVMRPGGVLLTLDFYLPPARVWRAVFLRWLSVSGGVVGWRWHREPMAYGYIARSIAHHTTAADFGLELTRSGFALAATESHLGGGIAIHHAVRR